jgi:hypothetical protein
MAERLAPGAPAAIAAGCTCIHHENFSGRGCCPRWGERPRFIVQIDCPVHGQAAWPVALEPVAPLSPKSGRDTDSPD